jgi:hypothetical protein
MNGNASSPILTANALEAVHVLLKPYKYFRDPAAVKETPPAELEAIVQQLLTPAFQIFHLLVRLTWVCQDIYPLSRVQVLHPVPRM